MSRCALCKTNLKDDETNVCDRCKLDFSELKKQLAKKDKEIEELKRDLQLEYAFTPVRGDGKTFTKMKVIQDFKNLIRKQVCDEIREKLPYFEYSFQEPEVPRVNVIEIRDIEFILDQMEQAKVN